MSALGQPRPNPAFEPFPVLEQRTPPGRLAWSGSCRERNRSRLKRPYALHSIPTEIVTQSENAERPPHQGPQAQGLRSMNGCRGSRRLARVRANASLRYGAARSTVLLSPATDLPRRRWGSECALPLPERRELFMPLSSQAPDPTQIETMRAAFRRVCEALQLDDADDCNELCRIVLQDFLVQQASSPRSHDRVYL